MVAPLVACLAFRTLLSTTTVTLSEMSLPDDPMLSSSSPLTSPVDESDNQLSPPLEPRESQNLPGLDGTPVRWFDADHKEPYTQITPFQEQNDTSVEFFYKPVTLTALGVGMAVLAYVAMTQDVLKEGEEKKRVGVYAAIASFLLFSMIQFRDGPFVRPHPAFWRVVLGINLLYELAMVFLLFQDLDSARSMMKYLDPNLGRPLPEKSYAENCDLTLENLWNAIDIFCLAHALGWFGKALILRDYWFCWCWWDHWILDVLVCNWLGTYLGMKTCQYFEVKVILFYLPMETHRSSHDICLRNQHYTWRGFRQTRGIRSKTKRVISQFSPHDWTTFKWEGTASFGHYFTVVLLLAVFLAAELNPFYLKVGAFLRKTVRMGQHVWLLLATIGTELLVIAKWSQGQFPEPLPTRVRWAWAIGAFLLVLYPTVRFGLPAARRYLRHHQRNAKPKTA
ncbi:hypothetical protein ACG7TL_006229 [Trametes sanguinea]